MNIWIKAGSFAAVYWVLVLAGPSSSYASVPVQAPAAPAAAGPGLSLQQVARSYCPQGIEHFVPGEYYYCVGVRELAAGRFGQSRSMLDIAARWGSKPAQFLLGIGYYKGDTGRLNRPLGLAWLQLASERGDPTYSALFRSAAQQATAAENAAAARMLQTMLPIYGDARAARRAERRYRYARRELTRNEAYGAEACIAGLTTVTIQAPHDDPATGRPESCAGSMPVALVAKKIDVYADALLEGWAGHVTVGDVQPVHDDEPPVHKQPIH